MPYYSEIRLFAGSFAPQGWRFCDGSILSIAEYEVLFTLIGTTYGGDGIDTFALPDLRGRVPMHQATHFIGEQGGVEAVQLTTSQMPQHTHALSAIAAAATTRSPAGALLAEPGRDLYTVAGTPAPLNSLASQGGVAPHDNMMPFTAINYIIAVEGVFPSET